MSFERQRHVASFWNWLPAFRAAAEFESMQRAALALGVSASAISRAVAQLERNAGMPLLERRSTGVSLTAAGRRLLEATRLGMRAVDDAVVADAGRLVVGTVGTLVPSLLVMCFAEHDEVSYLDVRPFELNASLHRGEVDVVVAPHRSEVLGVVSKRWASVPCVLCAPKGKELASSTEPWTPSGLDLHGALRLAERTGRALVLPSCLVPQNFRSLGRGEPLELYVTTRQGASKLGARTAALLEGAKQLLEREV